MEQPQKRIKRIKQKRLMKATEIIFAKYDTDGNGVLDAQEIKCLITDAFASLGKIKEVSDVQVDRFMNCVDRDNDGTIDKHQLLLIFKKLGFI